MADSNFPDELATEQPTRIRYVIVFVTMLMAILLYLDRFCVSFAVDYIREDLSLTQTEVSWFLSAFFWSYALAQVPSGWFSDRYGARIVLVIYILSWSFFTALIGAATSFILLLVARLGCGLGQAGAYPTSAGVVSKWVPFANRGTASAIIAFGGRVGGAVAPFLTAFLIVLFVPLSEPAHFEDQDLRNGRRLCAKLIPPDPNLLSPRNTAGDGSRSQRPRSGEVTQPSMPQRHLGTLLPEETRAEIAEIARKYRAREADVLDGDLLPRTPAAVALESSQQANLLTALNGLLDRRDLFHNEAFQSINLPQEALLALSRVQRGESLNEFELRRFNRLLLESTFPEELGKLYVRGWRPVMVVYGLTGLVVAALFWYFFRNRPDDHPGCNAAEQALIAAGRPVGAPGPHGRPGMVPWRRLVLSRSMWLICLAQLGTNVGWVFLVTWLPRYLIDVHNVPILQRGLMAMVPLLVGIGGMLLGGLFTDALVARVGLRWGRRLPMMMTRFTAALGYAFCLALAWQEPESWLNSPWLFVAAFSLVAFSTDMGSAATWAFKQDVGGRYVGSILGWGNMWGNLGAAVSPPIYNLVLGENPSIHDWNSMFLVCLGAFLFAGVCALGVDATIPIAPPDEAHDRGETSESLR